MSVIRLMPVPSKAPQTGEARDLPSDEALVLLAREGDRFAQETLFRRHIRRAAGLAQRLLASSPADVDDLLQDAFILAFGKLDSLKEPRAFGGWLSAIVVRTASKRLRRQRLRERLGLVRRTEIDMDDFSLPQLSGETLLELKHDYNCLQRFPAEEQVALLLRRVEGMELTEIAERTGTSPSTVKRRLRRAEARLSRIRGLGDPS